MTLTRIGRYEIERELGHGAMAVVYKAVDPLIGRVVAIKTIRLETNIALEKEELRQRLYREAQSAGKLNHPNIVTIYDMGEEGDLSYIAMEYIEGETLDVWKSLHTIPPLEQTIAIVEQIALGLDFAAASGVIHRDIKPGNIMLTPDLKVKIADFGIAKIATSKMTQTGLVMGTPSYMSPEQAMGKDLDGRSDLFSLGIIFYEMLTGEKPFSGTNPSTIIYKILHEEPVPPQQLNVTLHPGFGYIIRKMLAKDPAQRYQSCSEFLIDLKSYQSMDATVTIQAAQAPTAPVRRHNYFQLALMVVLTVTIGILSYVLYRIFQPQLQNPATFQPQKTIAQPQPPPPLKTAESAPKPQVTESKQEPSMPKSEEQETKTDVPVRKSAEVAKKPAFAKIRFTSAGADYTVTLFEGARKIKDGLSVSSSLQVSAAEHLFRIVNTEIFLDLSLERVSLEPDQVFSIPLPGLGSAYIEVPNDAYTGCEILMNGIQLSTPYPAQIQKLAAGEHRVTFRWSSGKYSGREFSSNISTQANHHYLITGNPQAEKVIIQMVR